MNKRQRLKAVRDELLDMLAGLGLHRMGQAYYTAGPTSDPEKNAIIRKAADYALRKRPGIAASFEALLDRPGYLQRCVAPDIRHELEAVRDGYLRDRGVRWNALRHDRPAKDFEEISQRKYPKALRPQAVTRKDGSWMTWDKWLKSPSLDMDGLVFEDGTVI